MIKLFRATFKIKRVNTVYTVFSKNARTKSYAFLVAKPTHEFLASR